MIRLFLLGFVLYSSLLPAQSTYDKLTRENRLVIQAYEDTLTLITQLVLRDTLPERRFQATKDVIIGLKSALQVPNSFEYNFPRLKTISIQYPADSSFRIFTWQLFVSDDEYRYFGAIQLNQPELALIPLIDRSFALPDGDPEQLILPNDQWYGVLYYRILQQDSPDGRYYLLFGYDADQLHHRRKLIDVLTLHEGKAVFGRPVFDSGGAEDHPPVKCRVIRPYAAASSFTLNYDVEREIILYDHTVTRVIPDTEALAEFPDGTYAGYRPVDGKWVYIPKVFVEMPVEVQRPGKAATRTRDLFGREKKQ